MVVLLHDARCMWHGNAMVSCASILRPVMVSTTLFEIGLYKSSALCIFSTCSAYLPLQIRKDFSRLCWQSGVVPAVGDMAGVATLVAMAISGVQVRRDMAIGINSSVEEAAMTGLFSLRYVPKCPSNHLSYIFASLHPSDSQTTAKWHINLTDCHAILLSIWKGKAVMTTCECVSANVSWS